MPGSCARRNLQKQGFSQKLSDRILGPQHKSTKKLYGARWSIFCAWCKSKERNPLKTSTPLIANFLNYLSNKKNWVSGQQKVYKTAIADFLRFHTQENFNEKIFLTKLIKLEAPRPKNAFPKWDLDIILNFLNQPFFVRSRAQVPKWKTVFLVTIALAARSSEVHALSFQLST